MMKAILLHMTSGTQGIAMISRCSKLQGSGRRDGAILAQENIFLWTRVCYLFSFCFDPPVESILSGYQVTPYTVRPFSVSELRAGDTRAARTRWNKKLSAARIAVEHMFGELKGRFPYLKWVPGRNLKRIYSIVEALFILHNILRRLGDRVRDILDYDPSDEVARIAHELINLPSPPTAAELLPAQRTVLRENAANLCLEGIRLRRDLVNLMRRCEGWHEEHMDTE